ncbi:MAG: Bug family tripartite tricarboxylate transporter substrate binding protein [Aquabacterium sp.]
MPHVHDGHARHLRRRTLLAAALPLAAAGMARAQAWPSRPIRLIVAFGTGSGNDLIARELAEPMSRTLGQSVVVENRPGGGGSLGTDVVAKAAPDGYTIGLGTSSQLVMNPALYKTLPFDVDRDLRGIGLISRTPLLLAASMAMPATLREVMAQAQAQPGRLTYASAGQGSITHIVAESFARATQTRLLHVPYKGNGPALVDLSGGHVNLLFDGLLACVPLARQGKLRMLALSSDRRSPQAPELPTFAEAGLSGYEAFTWNSLFAPARTPPEVVARLNDALNQALALPSIAERLARSAAEPLGPATPDQADAYARAQRERWVPFVRGLNIELS